MALGCCRLPHRTPGGPETARDIGGSCLVLLARIRGNTRHADLCDCGTRLGGVSSRRAARVDRGTPGRRCHVAGDDHRRLDRDPGCDGALLASSSGTFSAQALSTLLTAGGGGPLLSPFCSNSFHGGASHTPPSPFLPPAANLGGPAFPP